ncbi:dihydrolipoyl dehydrogenase [Pseudomonas sp. CrR25]|nr:dihydrolipoyl dehydrogenase [Pseudomonas sp. CrR25]
MAEQFDIVVIGAGPGGYVAGIRAAQLGLKACVIEKDAPGGVCLNWGCIPSKNLIHQADEFRALGHLEQIGVRVERAGLDYAKVQANSRGVAQTLSGGIRGLLRKNQVPLKKGRASIVAPGQIQLDGGELIQAKHIIVATGSRPMSVPGFEFDEERVLSSNGVLAMTELPKSLVILGGGVIGCEFAYVLNAFGVQVTLVEAMPHILPSEDFETVAVVDKAFREAGIAILTGSRAKRLTKGKAGVRVEVEGADGKLAEIEADKALVVFGRVPNTEDLGLEQLGVKLDRRGYIEIGDYCQSSVKGIYAIGDVTPTPALAHVASKEAEIAVERIAGHLPLSARVDPNLVPSAIYCEPQVAGFGLREDEARAKNLKVKKSVFPYRGAGKAVAVGRAEGLVKVLCDADSGEVLGGHIVGMNATELIHQLLLARQAELLPADVAEMIHAHPTLSEAVMEAMRGIDGAPIHI